MKIILVLIFIEIVILPIIIFITALHLSALSVALAIEWVLTMIRRLA